MISPSSPTPGRFALVSAVIVVLSWPLLAQTGNTVVGSAYNLDIPLVVAPGDIINLLVQGVGSTLSSRVTATSFPLPTTLAGITVTLNQQFGPSGAPQSQPVPILAIEPVNTCVNGSTDSCSKFVAITVQIPFEISLVSPNRTRLVVSEGQVTGGAMDVAPFSDHLHVVSGCDVETGSVISCANDPVVAPRLITHADGSVVTLVNPAKSGEELVLWAVGLGLTTPNVVTGQPSPSPAAITQALTLNFDYRVNTSPSRSLLLPPGCRAAGECSQSQPVFSGLTPGYAGLYQVNFIVPPPPPGTPACNDASLNPGNQSSVVSNLTVSVIALTSFDGGGICVDTSASSVSTTAATIALPRHASPFNASQPAAPKSVRRSILFGPIGASRF
ncbi:MAG TPA: hypothetical protein VJX67_20550 [Blastocatellia bacterium]|nr:hypothetical protein [Blastocatellia bacterium]